MAYHDIATDLRTQIDAGTLAPGDRLPSEAELMAAYGVARGTVRNAVRYLAAQGLVEPRHGSGTYVVDQDAALVERLRTTAQALTDLAAELEARPATRRRRRR